MNIKIIPATTDVQIQDVATLALTIWNEHFVSIIGQEQVDYMVAKFQSYPALKEQVQNDYEYFLFELDNTFLGYMGIRKEKDALFLSKLYLLQDARGKGIARKALHFLKELCHIYKLHRIWLTCNKYNEHTLTVYKHLGFQIIATQESDIGEGYIMDDYILEYILTCKIVPKSTSSSLRIRQRGAKPRA
jgi:Acetyltransferases, including N-acetylases of ribosomal proteins